MLPVIVRPALFDLVPPYLRSETLFGTQGNLPASVSLDVQRIASIHRRRTVQTVAGALVIAGCLVSRRIRHGPMETLLAARLAR